MDGLRLDPVLLRMRDGGLEVDPVEHEGRVPQGERGVHRVDDPGIRTSIGPQRVLAVADISGGSMYENTSAPRNA